MPLLGVRNVTKVYGNGFKAVDDVTFSFEGGVLGLVGPNGAGKSTLIKMMVGLIKITKGDIELLGRQASFENMHLDSIGILHERPAYPGNISIREYLEHAATLIGASESDIESIITMLDIESYSHKRIGSLSAGMLQKFGLADALLGFPKVAILDEPTSNLDPLNRRKVLETIRTLSKEYGMNFIVSTHILGELERVCDSIAIMESGRLVLSGDLDELVDTMFKRTYRVTIPGAVIEDLSGLGEVSTEAYPNFTIVTELSESEFCSRLFEILKAQDMPPYRISPVKRSLEAVFEAALKQ